MTNFVDDVVVPLIPGKYNPAHLIGEAMGFESFVPGLDIVARKEDFTGAERLLIGDMTQQSARGTVECRPGRKTCD